MPLESQAFYYHSLPQKALPGLVSFLRKTAQMFCSGSCVGHLRHQYCNAAYVAYPSGLGWQLLGLMAAIMPACLLHAIVGCGQVCFIAFGTAKICRPPPAHCQAAGRPCKLAAAGNAELQAQKPSLSYSGDVPNSAGGQYRLCWCSGIVRPGLHHATARSGDVLPLLQELDYSTQCLNSMD